MTELGGEPLSDSSVKLTKVHFDHVDCRAVKFSPNDPISGFAPNLPQQASFIDCTFINANLQDAVFNGAVLTWTIPPPDSQSDDDDRAYRVQNSYGPFYRSNLAGASFVKAIFKNADFREAEGVLEVDFTEAQGLDTAIFDNEKTRSDVLAKVNNRILKS